MRINVTLMCEHCAKATLHIFAERRADRVVPGERTFARLLYECDECGVVRAWGNEPRVPTEHEAAREGDAFDHAVRVHGMRRANCPACRGIGGDCEECSDRGWVWGFALIGPCRAGCPIGADGTAPADDPQKQNPPYSAESGGSGDQGDTEPEVAEHSTDSAEACAADEGTSPSQSRRKGTFS